MQCHVIDFGGRPGYVNTAIEAGVPIVPAVSIGARFGTHPDVDEVDGHIRWVMQSVLDELGRRRWFPILG